MDATKIDELDVEPTELARRRRLANGRYERECERKAILGKQVNTVRQADHLREWIAGQAPQIETAANTELVRMLQWARGELAALEAASSLLPLSAMLRAKNLFPDVDELADPLGDPPPLRPWGR